MYSRGTLKRNRTFRYKSYDIFISLLCDSWSANQKEVLEASFYIEKQINRSHIISNFEYMKDGKENNRN